MEINGVENYAKWVNKNFTALNKRQVTVDPPAKAVKKLPMKPKEKKEVIMELRGKTRSLMTRVAKSPEPI